MVGEVLLRAFCSALMSVTADTDSSRNHHDNLQVAVRRKAEMIQHL